MAKTWATKNGSRITLMVSGRNNVYLAESGDMVMLIDAGMSYMYDNLVYKLKRLGARPSHILLTHAHYDHAENAYRLREEFGAKLLVHALEAAHLSAGINPEDDPFSAMPSADSGNYRPVKPDIIVNDGYMAAGILILHTPGHTPGSVSAVIDGEVAAVGDSMFSVHPGQAMVPYVMDRQELLRSWEKLFKAGCGLFLPAHGRPVTRETALKEYSGYVRG